MALTLAPDSAPERALHSKSPTPHVLELKFELRRRQRLGLLNFGLFIGLLFNLGFLT